MTKHSRHKHPVPMQGQPLQQAITHHKAGRLHEAENIYRAILREEPNHPDANHNLGVLAVQAKQPAAALPHFEAALKADPNQGQYWLSYIDALIQTGQTDAARNALERGRRQGLRGEAADALAGRLEGPSSDIINTLVAMYNHGRYHEQELLARRLTECFSRNGFAWKALGTALKSQGKDAEALEALQKAAKLAPQDAETHNNLGIILNEHGRPTEAEVCYRRALGIRPYYAEAHYNLGNALREQGRFAEAEAGYRRALAIKPDYAEAHCSLGVTLQEQGLFKEAETSYRRSLTINPDSAETHNNLGVTLREQDRLTEAEASYRRALTIKPDYAEAYSNLGNTLREQGRSKEAETCCRRALTIKPDFAEAYNNLGNILKDHDRIDEAEASYRRALTIKPDHAEAHSNLGVALKEQGRIADAEVSLRRALAIKPDLAEAYSNLGVTLKEQGRLKEAEAAYRQALTIKSDYTEVYSNLLFALNYTDRHTLSHCLKEARDYGRLAAKKAGPVYSSWQCEAKPQRLRVGLVSGDLRHHPVGYFLEATVPHIDPDRIELIAYPTVQGADDLTARLGSRFAAWKPLTGLGDEAAARLIHADGIHILLDLSGHTSHNRLPVFAWKPAPVQATWMGYFATTGVKGMDYLLGDPHVTPAGEEDHFTETVWRLPECYVCFTPPDAAVDVGPLPALSAGCVTFGCFNNLAKMNDAVVALWSRLLEAVPGSRLFLKTRQLNDPAVCDAVRRRFAARGIASGSLILEGASPRGELLSAYNRVDIALDPFPYPGGVTSMEALWMGAPVLTRRGDRFLSHVGEGIARNTQMADWIAADDEDYLSRAVSHTGDLKRLAATRAGLRCKVLASPVFDAPRFARHVEEALWGMWGRWTDHMSGSR